MLKWLSTKYVKELIRRNELTENQFIGFFFITVLYDSFFHSLGVSRESAVDGGIWFQLLAWSFFICTVFIWLVCFFVNGGHKGERLLYKVIPLTITVGYKYALVAMAIPSFFGIMFEQTPEWMLSTTVYLINIMMALNICYHLMDINGDRANKINHSATRASRTC